MVYQAEPAPVVPQEGPIADDDADGLPNPPENSPEFLEDRRIVEEFAINVVQRVGAHCLPISCLPWTSEPLAGAIAASSNDGSIGAENLKTAAQGKTIFIVGCTFKYQMERAAATKVVEQLQPFQGQGICVLAAHLLPRGGNHYTRSNFERLMRVHTTINALGVDDVVLDPMRDTARLKLRLNLAHHSWNINQERLHSMLAEEPQPPPPEEVAALEGKLKTLLWKDIPRELMRHFKPMDTSWTETDTQVGEYTMTERLEAKTCMVYKGKGGDGENIAVKITLKDDVFTPGEVEGIYREYRFLAGFTRHPNIVRATACFHSATKVYTILDFAGDQSLSKYLSTQPGMQMREQEALVCFLQIGAAIAHCHSKDVAHRSVSADHVVVMPAESDGSLIPKLVDFRGAMVAKPGVPSVAMCGSLPCMSPEMLCGKPYLPKPVDNWSMGVLLMEMVAGMGAFYQAVGIDEANVRYVDEEKSVRAALADQIYAFFDNTQNCHQVAISRGTGAQCEEALALIQKLVQREDTRCEIKDLVPENAAAEGESGEQAAQGQDQQPAQ